MCHHFFESDYMWLCYESKLKIEIESFKIIPADMQAQWKYLPIIMIELSI